MSRQSQLAQTEGCHFVLGWMATIRTRVWRFIPSREDMMWTDVLRGDDGGRDGGAAPIRLRLAIWLRGRVKHASTSGDRGVRDGNLPLVQSDSHAEAWQWTPQTLAVHGASLAQGCCARRGWLGRQPSALSTDHASRGFHACCCTWLQASASACCRTLHESHARRASLRLLTVLSPGTDSSPLRAWTTTRGALS